MSTKNIKAVKHDEELAKLEAELVAQDDPAEQDPVEQTPEETVVTESAPVEEQTAEEKTEEPVEEATKTEEDELTEEEQAHLAEKTKSQMSKLREKARRAEELELELENLKKKEQARKPLEEVQDEYVKVEPEHTNPLPWDQPSLTPAEAKKLAREEIEKERKLSLISSDADYLEKEMPELNPTSDSYNPKLAEDIYSSFRYQFLKDDSARLRDVAQKKLELISEVRKQAEEKVAQERTIERQEAEQAPPVSVAPPKAKTSVSDLIGRATSVKELEALENKIGVAR